MKKSKIAMISLFTLLSICLTAAPGPQELGMESVEVAELLINLAPGIAKELAPPITGADRRVKSATITESAEGRIYHISGEDVYRDNSIRGTYWVRLIKRNGFSTTNIYAAGTGELPLIAESNATELGPEAKEVISTLLNALYDIEIMQLNHRRVDLGRIIKSVPNGLDEPNLSFEFIGLNNICEHADLNLFKITIHRILDARGRLQYNTEIAHPFIPEGDWESYPETETRE